MGVTEQEFVADLNSLQAVARLDLADMAFTYARLNKEVDGTTNNDGNAFSTCPASQGAAGSFQTGLDQVYGPWSALRDRLRNHLGKSALHLESAQRAIEYIVKTYAATDSNAASSIHDAWDDGKIPDDLKHQSKNQNNTDKIPPDPPTVVVE